MTSAARKPRNKLSDGLIYGRIVDPMLAALHNLIAKQVSEGAAVLDAGCGTGGLTVQLAKKCASVVAVDLSPRNIAFAERKCRELGLDNVSFEVGDISQLQAHRDDAFDIVTISMVLHEMLANARVPVLRELARVGKEIIVVDFAVPMPWNLAGVRNRFIEMAAGVEHHSGFRSFNKRGGLTPLFEEAGLRVESERPIDSRTTTLAVVRKR